MNNVKKEEQSEQHFCELGNHIVYGNGNVELTKSNQTPCHKCLGKLTPEKRAELLEE